MITSSRTALPVVSSSSRVLEPDTRSVRRVLGRILPAGVVGAVLVALLGVGAGNTFAQGGDGLRIGLAVGQSDYGTGYKLQLGAPLQQPWLRGPWRWEAQLTGFGSETYNQFGATFERSAWALGASALPQLPIAASLTAYGKLGVHYLSSEATGPGLAETRRGGKLGLGAGLRWQATQTIGLRAELENIGGSRGDLFTLGAEMPF